MEPLEPNTDIVEEKPAAATKGKGRTWLFAATIGVALLALGLFALFTAVSRTKPQTPQPRLTADDLEQQKYDARQQENEQLKAAQLRNDGFLVRKDEDTTLQLNNLMKDLQKDDALPGPHHRSQANPPQKRRPLPASSVTLGRSLSQRLSPTSPRPRPQSGGGANASNEVPQGSPQPMFVYSRSFGGAKYVEKKENALAAPQRTEGQSKEVRCTAQAGAFRSRSKAARSRRTKRPASFTPTFPRSPSTKASCSMPCWSIASLPTLSLHP